MNDPLEAGPSIRAAGGVVTRRRAGDREFLIVHRPRYDDWSLPKGKLDSSEKYRTAAKREIKEETGSTTSRLARLGSIAYYSVNSNPKLVRYWLFEHTSGKFKPNNEVDEVRWLSAADAKRMLTYPRDRKVFEWGATLADSPRAGRIHLVRHARAGTRSNSKKKDKARPLSKSGRAQARTIALSLTGTPVGRIFSSPYRRCEQTVAPLGTAIGEKVRHDKTLAEGARPEDLLEFFGGLEGKAVVMSSHGAEIASLLELIEGSGSHLDPRPEELPAKGSIWDLDLTAGIVTAGRHQPAPA
jgi:8-oxo-dGTP diphosphatase